MQGSPRTPVQFPLSASHRNTVGSLQFTASTNKPRLPQSPYFSDLIVCVFFFFKSCFLFQEMEHTHTSMHTHTQTRKGVQRERRQLRDKATFQGSGAQSSARLSGGHTVSSPPPAWSRSPQKREAQLINFSMPKTRGSFLSHREKARSPKSHSEQPAG